MNRPTFEQVKEILAYDPEMGVLTWIRPKINQIKTGTPAGRLQNFGYRQITLLGRTYVAHRVAWLLYTGRWPRTQIDHINCDPNDNRISNLREASPSQNKANSRKNKNNTTGYKGVRLIKNNRYRAEIMYNRKRISLGYFDTPEEGHSAYLLAAKKYFGEFARAE